MGISLGLMAAIIRESSRKPFSGPVCTFGRPTMDRTPEQTLALFEALKVEPAIGDPAELGIDTTTVWARSNPGERRIRDIDFFRMLGASDIRAIDVSDFEGAEIVWDLNQPIPPDLEGSFGLVVDGSVLDNVFDPTTALKNVGRLLAPGGRCFLENWGNHGGPYSGIPYTMFNPLWFFDYFVWNDFDYCQVYVLVVSPTAPTEVYAICYDHAGSAGHQFWTRPIFSENLVTLWVYAEKGARSTWAKTPTQHAYRSAQDWQRYAATVMGYRAQARRHLVLPDEVVPVSAGVPPGYRCVRPDGSDVPARSEAATAGLVAEWVADPSIQPVDENPISLLTEFPAPCGFLGFGWGPLWQDKAAACRTLDRDKPALVLHATTERWGFVLELSGRTFGAYDPGTLEISINDRAPNHRADTAIGDSFAVTLHIAQRQVSEAGGRLRIAIRDPEGGAANRFGFTGYSIRPWMPIPGEGAT